MPSAKFTHVDVESKIFIGCYISYYHIFTLRSRLLMNVMFHSYLFTFKCARMKNYFDFLVCVSGILWLNHASLTKICKNL